jgi:hypothetical protein
VIFSVKKHTLWRRGARQTATKTEIRMYALLSQCDLTVCFILFLPGHSERTAALLTQALTMPGKKMLINTAGKHLKVKEKSSLSFIKRHSIKTHGGMGCSCFATSRPRRWVCYNLAQATLRKFRPNGSSKRYPMKRV